MKHASHFGIGVGAPTINVLDPLRNCVNYKYMSGTLD